MEPILTSAFIVALAEIGDKTQLLTIVLAARFQKPGPIILGIFVATILNHTLAATFGYFISDILSGQVFRTVVGLSFIAMALWTLVPDKHDEKDSAISQGGVFLTTLIAFFLVEMGDKTQIATALLAARFHEIVLVAIGTTIGMMLANVPAVFFGEIVTKVVPLKYVRWAAAGVFAVIGIWILLSAFHVFGL